MLLNINPWSELERIRRELDSVFSRGASSTTFPLVNVYDVKNDIIVEAELPGMVSNDINITYNDGILTLSGERKQSDTYKEMTVVRSERSVGDFEKSFRIPSKVDQNKISASFNNGILTITMPKSEEAKPKQISIEAH